MTLEDDGKSVDDAGEAAFAAAFASKEPKNPPAQEKPEPATETARVKEEPAPEYVQLTKDEVVALRAISAEMLSLKQQQAKETGNIGNLYKAINELKSNKKAELSSGAFTKLKDQFPELADMTKEAVENALSGRPDTKADEATIERLVAQRTAAREIEVLEDAHPDWRDIVGAVSPGEQPNADNSFRKWLATKDATYQARVNGTESAAVLTRAITRFQTETKKPAAPRPSTTDEARREQLRESVQPRGDGAPPTSGKSDDEPFLAGFAGR